MANFISNDWLRFGLASTMSASSIVVILVDGTCALDDEDVYLNAGTLGEISVTGYTSGHGGAGRQALASKAFTTDNTNNQGEADAANNTWSSLGTGATIQGAILAIAGTTGDTDARIICRHEVTGTTGTPTNGGDFTIQWNAEGYFKNGRAAGS